MGIRVVEAKSMLASKAGHPSVESAKTFWGRIESFAERTYSDPLRMTHLIAKNPVTPANRRLSGLAGEISGLVDATRRANARLINVFMTATYEVGERRQETGGVW